MGTREVYEKKLKSGNLHFDPTMNPGLGTPRCPRCYTIIDPNSRSGSWTITPELHDVTKVAGFGIGGLLSAVFGVNTGIPFIQKHIKGPKWMQLSVKIPSLLLLSGAGAATGLYISAGDEAYVVPKFGQLTVSSYYAAHSTAHYVISQATRRVEALFSSQSVEEKH